MNAYDIETSIAEGRDGFESLIQLVRENAESLEAHEMEALIFQERIPLGLAALVTCGQRPTRCPGRGPKRGGSGCKNAWSRS